MATVQEIDAAIARIEENIRSLEASGYDAPKNSTKTLRDLNSQRATLLASDAELQARAAAAQTKLDEASRGGTVAPAKAIASSNAELNNRGIIDPGLTAQYGITDPDLVKYLGMVSMPVSMVYLDPAAGGSRGQESKARADAINFEKMGGQAELDRLTSKIQTTPDLASQLQAYTNTNNTQDAFSKIGNAFVSAVPVALTALAAYYLGPLAGEAMGVGAAAGTGAVAGANTAAMQGGSLGDIAKGGVTGGALGYGGGYLSELASGGAVATGAGISTAELAAADPYLQSMVAQGATIPGVTAGQGALAAQGVIDAATAANTATGMANLTVPGLENAAADLAGSAWGASSTAGVDPYLSQMAGSGYTGSTGNALSSLASPELASAQQTLAQKGITREVLQQASTNPSMMEQITAATGLSANTLSSLVSGAASLYGANQAAGSAADAAAIQKQASDAALAEQKRQFDLGQEAQMPWRTAGESALTEQTNLMGLGTQGAEGQLASLMKSPGYEFRLGEGQKALERSAAARGGLFGGATGKALTQYGQDYATGEYGNRLSQLSSLSGQGQAAASGQAGLGQQYAGNVSNLLTGMGNAGADSSIAQGAAKQSGILGAGQALSSLFNPPKQQQSLADLLKGYGYAN